MEIVKRENPQYDEYEALLLTRDQLEREAGSFWTAYLAEFGQLEADVFEEKVECIRKKKIIAYYQTALNRGAAIDQDAMQAWLAEEMQEYQAQLKSMIEDVKTARASKTASPYQIRRIREIYRRIARKIHPDTHPGTDRDETLSDLWEQCVKAYHANDLKRISELEVLVNRAVREQGGEPGRIDVPDLTDRIRELKEEIEQIRSTSPYTLRYLLEDQEAVAVKKKALSDELETYIRYRHELEDVTRKLLQESGVSIRWRMN